MDIGLFDNFEDDGQLSLFGLGEDVENLRETDSVEERSAEQNLGLREAGNAEEIGSAEVARSAGEIRNSGAAQERPSSCGAGVRIRHCSCCGKLLFVREEENCYFAACNACGVSYMQKA